MFLIPPSSLGFPGKGINSIELSVQDLTVSLKSTSLSPNIVQVGNSKADVLLHINYLEKSPFQ